MPIPRSASPAPPETTLPPAPPAPPLMPMAPAPPTLPPGVPAGAPPGRSAPPTGGGRRPWLVPLALLALVVIVVAWIVFSR